MSKQTEQNENVRLSHVFIVSAFGNIVGVYAFQDDAAQAQRDLINKNRPADVYVRPIIYPLNS